MAAQRSYTAQPGRVATRCSYTGQVFAPPRNTPLPGSYSTLAVEYEGTDIRALI